jgi:uncharacterized protein (TIGR03067 family)
VRLRLFAAVIALCLTAFAPAPFERPARQRADDGLARLQGSWKVTEFGRPDVREGALPWLKVRVKGARWTFLYQRGDAYVPSTTYVLKLAPRAAPQTIDLVHDDGQGLVTLKGIYKVEGNTVTIVYVVISRVRNQLPRPEERPASFDNLPDHVERIIMRRE